MVPCGPDSNPLDLDTHKLLNKLNILPRISRQIIPSPAPRGRLLPAGESLVHGLGLGQGFRVGGEAVERLAIDGVGGSDLELGEGVQDVELCQVERGVVVAGVRVLEDDEVEPAAATFAACCYADFVADGLEGLADAVELFCWEGAAGWGY
jgi:hypothetical protein